MSVVAAALRAVPVLVLALLARGACAQPGPPQPPSPAERQIASARKAIAAAPDRADGHVALALGLARRARETADPQCYVEAAEAVATALRLEPGNFEAEKLRIWILLGQHDFQRALDLATALNKRVPDDVLVYGFLVDAHAELGQYEQAEAAAQWMLDLRPGNIPGLTRAAYLRELFGDVDGAIELMDAAFTRTRDTETEDRAWILTQLGHLKRSGGRLADAEILLNQALALFPDYHYALGELGRVRLAEGRNDEAAALLQRRYEVAPHPENRFEWAVALHRAGRRDAARQQFTAFEESALRESGHVDNANRELVAYYVDYASRPADALRVATAEIARRRDVYTLDAYALALRASGRHDEARRTIEQALAVGVRDARLLYHAGTIAAAQQDHAAAVRYLEASLQAASRSEVSQEASRLLEEVRRRRRIDPPGGRRDEASAARREQRIAGLRPLRGHDGDRLVPETRQRSA
jgi:tetratricopeptide (TPR) repeat protein